MWRVLSARWGEAREQPGGGSDGADQSERTGRLRAIFVEKAFEVLGEEFGRFPEPGRGSGSIDLAN
jgi:hypothetical protein